MKIKFEKKDWNDPKDEELYEKAFDDLAELDDKDVFLLKDDRTEFKSFKEGFLKDIRSTFIIVTGKEFAIKIKGNLSFNSRDKEIRFFPIFVDKFGKYLENQQYFYKVNLEKIDDKSLPLSQRMRQNEEEYKKILDEFSSSKHTPVIASTEWKSFIEPYEYYTDLKFRIVKQDFEFFEGFDTNLERVIKVNSKDDEYENLFENGLYLEHYDGNRETYILIDYNKYKNLFQKDYLRQNSFFLAKKFEEYNKKDKAIAERRVVDLNSKFSRIQSKSTFFTTDRIYTIDDLRRDGKNRNGGIELNTEKAYAKEVEEKTSIVELNYLSLKKTVGSLKKIEIGKEITLDDLKLIEKTYLQNQKESRSVYETINLLKKNITSKIDVIFEDDISKVNEIVNSIDNVAVVKYSEMDKAALSEIITSAVKVLEEFKNNHKKEMDDYEIKWKAQKNGIEFEYNTKITNMQRELKSCEDKDEKEEIKSKIDGLKYSLKLIVSDLENSRNKKKEAMFIKHEQEINTFHESLANNPSIIAMTKLNNSNVDLLMDETNELISKFSDSIIRTVVYNLEINLLFDFRNKDDKTFMRNVYVLNTGDMVLVDTIKRIITNIKRGDEMNNEILNRIIGKQKMNAYIDDSIKPEDIEFIPPQYEDLNESQKRAFRISIDNTDPISIIQGPPGTGKTETITNIIKYFRNKGKKVILSSQTNVAIKNVIEKLCSHDKVENSVVIPWLTTNDKMPYSTSEISSTWSKKIISNIEKSNSPLIEKWKSKRDDLVNEEDILREFSMLRDAKVFGATTTTSTTLPGRGYDDHLSDVKVLIIDEVSKSILPEMLRYSLGEGIEKVILVGDYKQLNPIFDIDKDKIEGEIDSDKFRKTRKEIEDGIFYKLAKDAKAAGRVAMLDVNYRSVPGVLDAYNVFYKDDSHKDGLKGFRTFEEYKERFSFENSEYFTNDNSMYFVDISGSSEQKRGTSRYNKGEVKVLLEMIEDLSITLENPGEKEIAVIFPYAAQINLFSNEMKKPKFKKIKEKFKNLVWDTVDSFQGSEANIVFLSTVVTSNGRNFLSDFRRVNVAMSRAKEMLVILGNSHVIKNIEVGGEGIETDKYFSRILDPKENEYLKVIKRKVEGE